MTRYNSYVIISRSMKILERAMQCRNYTGRRPNAPPVKGPSVRCPHLLINTVKSPLGQTPASGQTPL